MANVRIKRVKSRPIDSRERLPNDSESVDGQVFVYFDTRSAWQPVTINLVVLWAKHYTFFWAPARSLS